MSRRIARIALAFSIVSGLGASASAQVPVFKLWVTEVYELEQLAPDEWLWTPKCGDLCPTQNLPQGVAWPGDYIDIEVTVEEWDADPDIGVCNDRDQTPGCTVGDDASCPLLGSSSGVGRHCTYYGTPCFDNSDCSPPSTCDPDICLPHPLVWSFQWTVDSVTFSNGGPDPGLTYAEFPCSVDEHCWCPHDPTSGEPPEHLVCAPHCEANGVCSAEAVICVDWRRSDFIFSDRLYSADVFTAELDRGAKATIWPAFSELPGVPEFDVGPPPRSSPYHLGAVILEATPEACGSYLVDLRSGPFATFLASPWDQLPLPEVEPATINFLSFCDGVTCDQTPPTCMRNWCDPCTGLCEILPDDGAACDDGDPCTLDDTCCGDVCTGTPMECPAGEVCFHGECWPSCSLEENVVDAFPSNCAIDACQPHRIDDPSGKLGWQEWIFTFNCDPRVTGRDPSDFRVTFTKGLPPLIETVVPSSENQTLTVRLREPIPAGQWTCLEDVDSDHRWCAGHLPGDANGDGTSSVVDVDALTDGLEGIEPIPDYAGDINCSGTANGQDILRLIDLLNGAGSFDAWIGRTLPRCPS